MAAKPKLGQNFLRDPQAIQRIIAALGPLESRTVVEIGPGKGAITEGLAARAKQLITIELDRELAWNLQERFSPEKGIHNVIVRRQDVLEFDLAAAAKDAGESLLVVGNLPYYITSDILLHLFAAAVEGKLRRAVLMMQREVGERVAASPGVRDYGLLSATAQMNARVETLFTLAPEAFSPPPGVFSTVLRLEFAPRFGELGVDAAGFDAFLKRCFAQKRKTLANNLRAAGWAGEELRAAWPASVPPQARAESLALEPLAELYRALGPRI